MKSKKTLIIIIAVAVVVLALAALGIFGFWRPYAKAVSGFSKDRIITLAQQDNGRIQVSWPAGENADRYLLEVLIPDANKEQDEWAVEFSANVEGATAHVLMPLPNENRAIRVRTQRAYKFLIGSAPRYRTSDDPLLICDNFTAPAAPKVTWTADPDADTVTVKLDMEDSCSARVYEAGRPNGPVTDIPGNEAVLTFGEGKMLPMPGFHDDYNFTFQSCRQTDSYVFYGNHSQAITVTREDLLGYIVNITVEENPGNSFTLKWNEVKGDYYLLQWRKDKNATWENLQRYPVDGELAYTTDNLKAYTYREYRVVTYRDSDPSDTEPMSKSQVTPLKTASSLVYSTIWPIKDLTVYKDSNKTAELGTANKGKTFCILELKNGMFKIRTPKGYGYIDSNYCMINLSEFLGELLKYDIANSYESMFALHDVEIPEVTGQVVTGYERVKISENEYLVPYIYPAALKLEKAGLAAQEEGYFLKIYDSFRPQKATQELYDIMVDMCPDPVPQPPTENADGTLTYPTDEEGNPLYILKEDGTQLTIQEYITDNNRYKLNYFLAKGTSRHNRGAALDLTLEKNGEEIEMQTPIHDLSWYSETAKNNAGAKKLAKFMKGAGFTGLVSEWWHFQDDEALKGLELPALYNGVTPEGWMADANGWRYRRANGSYYTNCEKTIDGVSYTFDKDGYTSDPTFQN